MGFLRGQGAGRPCRGLWTDGASRNAQGVWPGGQLSHDAGWGGTGGFDRYALPLCVLRLLPREFSDAVGDQAAAPVRGGIGHLIRDGHWAVGDISADYPDLILVQREVVALVCAT